MEKINRALPENFKAGYTVIIGEPNVGKSTLMNSLIGEKITIVTPKPQTTRHKIIGILSRQDCQIIFVDTPGLLKPKYLLHDKMMKLIHSAINDADILLAMVDAASASEGSLLKQFLSNQHGQIDKTVFLVINKIDLVAKRAVQQMIDSYSKKYEFKEIFPISALYLTGIDILLNALMRALPVHPPYYPLDILSEHSERFFVSEIIREKIFGKYRDEIPYSTAVNVVEFREIEGRKDFISAEIFVERESQKAIIIGKEGLTLKEIGQLSRKEIEKFLNRPVFLELHVKVREKWRSKENLLKSLGYR